MNVKHQTKIAICPNKKCATPIKISEGRYMGGINDKGGFVIECEKCKKIFPFNVQNPYDLARVVENGKELDKWYDEMPSYFEKKYNFSNNIKDSIDSALVIGNEPLPKIDWKSSEHSFYKENEINFELLAEQQLTQLKQEINKQYKSYYNWYLKGRHSANKSFVIINYNYEGVSYKSIFAKRIDSENDLHTDNLYLVNIWS